MNKVVLLGRTTKAPDIRGGETKVARFTLAVDRKKKGETDFISCVAFGRTADFLEQYIGQGSRIAIEGRIQTGSYMKDNQKIYTTDVIAESVEFAESKKKWEDAEGMPFA